MKSTHFATNETKRKKTLVIFLTMERGQNDIATPKLEHNLSFIKYKVKECITSNGRVDQTEKNIHYIHDSCLE